MTQALKVNNDSAMLYKRASDAIKLQKKIDELNEVLDGDKAYFREAAGGDTLSVEVSGVGALMVKKPSAATTKDVLVFDEDKFQFLSAEIKNALLSLGVVTTKTVTRAEGKASVVLTPNK